MKQRGPRATQYTWVLLLPSVLLVLMGVSGTYGCFPHFNSFNFYSHTGEGLFFFAVIDDDLTKGIFNIYLFQITLRVRGRAPLLASLHLQIYQLVERNQLFVVRDPPLLFRELSYCYPLVPPSHFQADWTQLSSCLCVCCLGCSEAFYTYIGHTFLEHKWVNQQLRDSYSFWPLALACVSQKCGCGEVLLERVCWRNEEKPTGDL